MKSAAYDGGDRVACAVGFAIDGVREVFAEGYGDAFHTFILYESMNWYKCGGIWDFWRMSGVRPWAGLVLVEF